MFARREREMDRRNRIERNERERFGRDSKEIESRREEVGEECVSRVFFIPF